MNKFSQTIHNLYNKILPIAEQSGVELDLDYSDPATIEFDVETDDPELKAELEEELKNAITRTNSGSIKLKVANGAISITLFNSLSIDDKLLLISEASRLVIVPAKCGNLIPVNLFSKAPVKPPPL